MQYGRKSDGPRAASMFGKSRDLVHWRKVNSSDYSNIWMFQRKYFQLHSELITKTKTDMSNITKERLILFRIFLFLIPSVTPHVSSISTRFWAKWWRYLQQPESVDINNIAEDNPRRWLIKDLREMLVFWVNWRPSLSVKQTRLFAGFLLVYANNEVLEKTEVLVYDTVSLIAEFGGALGLFLGFSFLMVWDLSAPFVIVAYNRMKKAK